MEEYLKQYENYKLCYVESSEYISEPMTLYFTELKDITKQWGDDWDDAPYEHNAGEPYTEDYSKEEIKVENGRGVYPKIGIFKVYLDGTYGISTPRTGLLNSPYCVEDINKGITPWLIIKTQEDKSVFIKAGTTLKDTLKTIKKYVPRVDIFVPYNV